MNNLKNYLEPVCANRENFRIVTTKDDVAIPNDLDPDILADLFEICVKFGQEDKGTGNIYLNITNEEGILFRIFVHFGNEYGLFIAASTDKIDETDVPILQAVLAYGITLFWQSTNTREIVQQAISEADNIAEQKGYLVNGKRKMINYAVLNSVNQQ